MKKYWKWILAIVAAGTAAGLLIAHFVKKNNETDEPDEFDEDDFDLDVDLQPVSEREYVSLKKATSAVDADKTEETTETTQTPETSETEEPVESSDKTEE